MTAQEFIENMRALKTFGFPVLFTVGDNSMFVLITIPEGSLELEFPVESKDEEILAEDVMDIVEAVNGGLVSMGIETELLETVMEGVYEQTYYHAHGRHSWEGTDEA